jgi:methylenetetrahydrofolate reductase (NADPH)
VELAAKQVAIARGLGFRGAYLAGNLAAPDVARILDAAAKFGPQDWRAFAREVAYAPKGSFRMFAQDPETGLATDELEPAYGRSLTPRARRAARRHVSPWYKANRLAHRAVFAPGAPGFPVAGRAYGTLERVHLGRPLHVLEQAVKVPLYGICELAPRRCIWVRAYERLKPYGEELTVLERPVVIADNHLRRTSAWANTFLGRDHIAKG